MVPGQRLLKFGRTQFAKVAYVTFYNNQRMKKVELHKQLFPSGSEVFSDWNRFFEGPLSGLSRKISRTDPYLRWDIQTICFI